MPNEQISRGAGLPIQRRLHVVVVLVLSLTGQLQAATPESLLTSKEKAAARKIYVAKCAKCHRFYDPKNYGEAQWTRWMESMSEKSKLKADQRKLLSRYLEDYRAGKIEKTH